MKILMVCLGNICRSPLAEGILQQLADKNNLPWEVHSAGTNGLQNGEAPHHFTQKIALLHGIDIGQQVSKKITEADIAAYDKIYVMAEDIMADVKKIAGSSFDENKIQYFLKQGPTQPFGNNVPDPWYGGEEGFVTVHKIIADTCQAIITNYKK